MNQAMTSKKTKTIHTKFIYRRSQLDRPDLIELYIKQSYLKNDQSPGRISQPLIKAKYFLTYDETI